MAGIKRFNRLFILPGALWLVSCASTEELFAEYDSDFCPAPAQHLVEPKIVEKEVFLDRVVVKEIPAKGKVMPWDPAIYFDTDSAEVSVVAAQALRSNLEFLNKFPRFKVSIRGFTDLHSYDDYNWKLSVERISRVREFYRSHGIASNRIVGRAHGESLSVNDESSPVIDDINRRVEMILLDSVGRPLVRQQPLVLGPAE